MLPRRCLHGFLSLALVATLPSMAHAQVDKVDLAKKAKAILETNCYECHGKGGSADGKVSYIRDLSRLVERKKVVPGKPEESRLYKKIVDELMPPPTYDDGTPVKQRPSAADVAVIKQWIEAGAPDFNPPANQREFVSPTKMLELMRDDLKVIDPRDQKFIRYFTLTHLSNAGYSDDEMQSYRNALSKLVNSLSWSRDIVAPKPIDPAKSILRINLNDYDWDEKTWDAILAANPYGVIYPAAAAHECYRQTQCKLPHVRGDWFVHAAARPPLYHTILKLPKTDKELEKELRIDVAENIRRERVRRAGFNGSGVSQNNRLLEWHKTGYGAYWKSYDFAGKVDRKNLFQYPLGPGNGNEFFQHDGGEIIFNLPNKLQAYMLIDGKGNRIDRGPLTVVSDPKQKDRTVVNGISCMSCHSRGMIEKDDQVREAVLRTKDGFAADELATILRLYPEKKDFNKLLRESAEDFRKAVEATVMEDPGVKRSKDEPIVTLSARFEDEVDLKLAAAETGVTTEEFLKGLAKAPTTLGRAFSTLRVDGGTVQRDVLVKEFGGLVKIMNLGQFQPPSLVGNGSLGGFGGSNPGEERAFEIAPGVKMVFCWIPPSEGKVKLGSPLKEEDRSTVEAEHDFQTTGFWLAKYPTTQEEWVALMKSNPSNFDGKKDNKAKGLETSRFPVEEVSWNECQEYVKKLNGMDNIAATFGSAGKFSLPHEDQWEYAARGGRGNQQPFYWGRQLNGTEANCDGGSPYGTTTKGQYLERTCAVDFTNDGKYEKHPWGLCHMAGNVYQWCENTYDASGAYRVIRGGSWGSGAGSCRSALRDGYSPGARYDFVGFRVALVPSGQ